MWVSRGGVRVMKVYEDGGGGWRVDKKVKGWI